MSMLNMTRYFVINLVIIGMSVVPVTNINADVDENLKNARRILEEGYNNRDSSVLKQLLSSDFVNHTNGVTKSPANMADDVTHNLELFPDFNQEIKDIIGAGDLVMARLLYTGTHSLCGKPVEVHGVFIYRFRDGKAVEGWQMFDQLAAALTLGFKLEPPEEFIQAADKAKTQSEIE